MPDKLYLTSRLPCWQLLVLVVSVLCVNVAGATTDSKLSTFNSVPSNFVTGVNRDAKRLLRRGLSTTADKTDDSYEDRVPNVSSRWKLALAKLVKKSKADKLFSKFKVGKATSNLLDSNEFVAWFIAVQTAYKNNPGMARVDMVSSLRTHYDDRTLAKWMATTEDDKFIREMKDVLLSKWQQESKTVKSVYKLLQLDKEDDKLFKSPLLTTWITYATKLDSENPYTAVFSALKERYDGKVLANMLFTAKENDDMKALAEKLELLLLKSWQREEKSVVDVYKLLNLDKEGDQLFKNPFANSLLKYATMTDKKNPFDGVLSMLQTRYNDEVLTDMLIGMRYWGPRNILTDQLEELLLKNWQHDGKTIMDIFRQLKLDKPGGALFENPVLATWVSYVAKMENNPYDVVFSILKSGYGEKALASMIVAARDSPRTKTLAKNMENIQLSSWEKADYTLGHAFNLLKLNAQGEEAFESLALRTWISHANKIDEAKADEAVLTVLK